MKNDKPFSEADSAATPRAERQLPSRTTTEVAYLAERATDAKSAIVRSMSDMKHTLAELADLSSCAARHPWIAVGSASAAGVLIGAALSRSRRKNRRRRTEARDGPESLSSGRATQAAFRSDSTLSSLSRMVLAAALPALIQGWFAAAAAKGQPRGDSPESGSAAGAAPRNAEIDDC
jgi:ElaB/YqjD/DUF883 family membrane-anchored ribosome-binding protein